MPISQALLPEFDHEMATTRRVLERVPEGNYDWKPHEKSMTIGRLAGHVAELPGWVPVTLEREKFDMATDGAQFPSLTASSRKSLLEAFDKNVATARKAIAAASDEQFMKNWSLIHQGKPVFTMPRAAVLRSFTLSHIIHHRGQLSVYLRLNNVPVPSIYGPSADENTMAASG
jgi:uncharacterized damage-inducible protein DinB